MKPLTGILCILCSLFMLSGVLQAAEPYRIGAILSVTGAASFLGEPEKNTVLMLQEEINAAGGINGHPLEVIIEDSKSEETQAVLAAKKLIENDKDILAEYFDPKDFYADGADNALFFRWEIQYKF